jgi:hypothetical protein
LGGREVKQENWLVVFQTADGLDCAEEYVSFFPRPTYDRPVSSRYLREAGGAPLRRHYRLERVEHGEDYNTAYYRETF